jgi:hypothetical protein
LHDRVALGCAVALKTFEEVSEFRLSGQAVFLCDSASLARPSLERSGRASVSERHPSPRNPAYSGFSVYR